MLRPALLLLGAAGLIHAPSTAFAQDSAAAKPAAAPAAGVSRRLAPRGSPQGWVVNDDYPALALWEHQEGIVSFRLDVGIDGRVVGCTITASSGHALLDDQACSLLKRRARFDPALDAQGRPVAAAFNSRFNWKLPDQPAPWSSWAHVTRVEFAQGRVTKCEVKEVGTPKALASNVCGYLGQMPAEVVDIITGDADSVTFTAVERHEVSGKPLSKPVADPVGTRVFRYRITYDVLPNGKAAQCKLGEAEGGDFLIMVRFRCHPGLQYPAAAQDALRHGSMTITVTTTGEVPIRPAADGEPDNAGVTT